VKNIVFRVTDRKVVTESALLQCCWAWFENDNEVDLDVTAGAVSAIAES